MLNIGNFIFKKLYIILLFLIQLNIFSCLSQKFDNFIQYNIEENRPVGFVIGKISEDIKRNSNPIWFLSSANLHFSLSSENLLFDLDSNTGIIKTKQVIDLETLCPENCIKDKGVVNLTVNIWSQINLQGIAKVSIIIEDINDNYPVFEQPSVEISIKEMLYTSGKIIKLPRATDIDVSLKNREISYKLNENSEYFELKFANKIQPELVVRKTLDSEAVNKFHLVLLAWNTYFPRLKYTELNVIINVIDINDNEPSFSKPLYLIPVPENTPVGSIVHKISASDLDVDSHLTYSSADPTSPITSIFKIELQGTIKLLRSLDYESQAFYYMSVKVTDGEFNAFSKLKIVVIDVNDETPQFNLNPTNISVYENSEPKEIAQVSIFDRDSEDINGKIKCYEPDNMKNKQIVSFIPNLNNYLQYTIKLMLKLDRDVKGGDSQYALFICEDNGIPMKLTATCTVTINVLDRNDNYPIFSEFPKNILVKENTSPQTSIYNFEATDKDKDFNAKIKYSIMKNTTDEDCCVIDEDSGSLFSLKPLDREKRDHYQLIIIATDQSRFDLQLTTSINVNITVQDENDEIPKLLKPHNFSIAENQPFMTHIGTLRAQDNDIGVNSDVKFSLVTDTNSVYFILSKNGSLFSRRKFDREEKDEYCLGVTIEDLGIQISNVVKSVVCIKILDENDNAPIINLPDFEKISVEQFNNKSGIKTEKNIYRLNVSIHSSLQHPIAYVNVKDYDTGDNGNTSLKLIPDFLDQNIINLVSIDEERKEFFLSSLPEKKSKECFQYTIIANDNGKPVQKTEKIVLFCFINVPAERPVIAEKDRFLSVSKANILIVIILAGTSAFLTALLVSAILCMIQPCKELSRRRYNHSQNVLDTSNQNQNESMMDNLLKSREEFDENFLHKISESSIDSNLNIKNQIQDNWPLKLMTCNDLSCQSVIIPQSSFITCTEEQRSDSGRGASDEDNNIITSSININKLNQMNQSFLLSSLSQSQQCGSISRKGANEINLFANCGCELFPKVVPLNRQSIFPQNIDSNSLKVYSKLPMNSTKTIPKSPLQTNSDLIMENSLYRSNVSDTLTIPVDRQSPVLSISDLSSHIDNLFFSQCCKKY